MKRDLTHLIATDVTISPQTIGTTGSSSVNGEGVDRKGYESVVFVFNNSKPEGTPTGITITCKIQESSDNGVADAFADVTSASTTHAVTNTYSSTEVAISDATTTKRYLRGVMSYSATGGTGDWTTVDGIAILGSPKTYPV